MSVAQLFRDAARRYAARPAIAFARNDLLSYAELDRLSNQAARFLLEQGVKKGERVGLCLEKSASFYILLLAALKIGAPYFALDPNNPGWRIGRILEQCRPRMIFSHKPPVGCPPLVPVLLCPEGNALPGFCDGRPEGPLPEMEMVGDTDPAYIMFTSGSTGSPKGAVISHGNLAPFIRWAASAYGFTPEDVHTHLNPVYFDNSVFDIYSTLFTGGRLVPFDAATLLDPGALGARLEEMACTVWFSVPSLLIFAQVMKVATPESFKSLRILIFGGEGYPKVKLKALMDSLGTKDIQYHNVYGPTECTCICSSYRVTKADFAQMEGLPPLGSLTAPFTGYILDGDRPVALGETGELCLSGPCVGLGYYGQPEATKGAFVQNPIDTAYNGVLYRTGDRVRQDSQDGKLYFAGRNDLQIKHMGYRIELEEIQNALNLCGRVDESAVVCRHSQEQTEIIAIIASRQAPDVSTLRSELVGYIPKYMIPAKYHFLERLPKNANGKIDRQALVEKYGS